MAHEVALTGCAPVPIAGYMKALGVLRLVADQVDRDAAGYWRDESFVLRSALDLEELRKFLLIDYRPSPVVAPWNGGSGFYPRDNREALDAISNGAAARFNLVRSVIAAARAGVAQFALDASPKTEEKAAFLAAVRGGFPDDALPWIDTAVLLGAENPRYPPLLGTGGNDGRLDFTNNFLKRLIELIDPDTGAARREAAPLLDGALLGVPTPGLVNCAIGQFAPGSAGGPNAATGFTGSSIVNPWDYILALEGTLLLTAAATRRLESTRGGALSYPFTVRATGTGSGAGAICDEQPSRGEIWLPVWTRAASHREIAALFREGRATVGRRAAADGFDFRRAVASLGVDRGIDSFARYSFAMRSGRAYLATPLGRVRVAREPQDDLLVELDRHDYLENLRRAARKEQCPASLRASLRELEEDIYNLLGKPARRRFAVQQILIRLGSIERTAGASRFARDEARIRPVSQLSPDWALAADDGSDEFRLAASLAGLRAHPCPFRAHVTPVKAGERGGWLAPEWLPDSALAVFDASAAGFTATLQRRLLVAKCNVSRDSGGSPNQSPGGAAASDPKLVSADAMAGLCRADLAALAAFIRGDVDMKRIAELATGLSLTRLPRKLEKRESPQGVTAGLPAAVAVLITAFAPPRLLTHLEILPTGAEIARSRRVVALLAADRVEEAVALAWRSLRLAGMRLPLPSPPLRTIAATVVSGQRLAAALLFPANPAAVAGLARRLLAPADAGVEPTRGGRS